MRIIDEDGRLFETINIIDALVVFLVLAIGVSGLVLVVEESNPNTTTETRNITFEVDANEEYLAEQIDVGDTSPTNTKNGSMTITDIYVSPTESGVQTIVFMTIVSQSSDGSITIDGKPLRPGQQFQFENESYRFNGSVRTVGGKSKITSTEVLVMSNVSAETASEMGIGDTYRLAGRSVATIENLTAYGTKDPNRKRAYVGMTVRTLNSGESRQFRDRPIREGTKIPFRTSNYNFNGEVVRIDALQQPGKDQTRTVILEMKNVPPNRANSVETGLTETNTGQTIARVTNVEVDRATIAVKSESGNIYEREHPVTKDVTLTVEMTVRERAFGTQFKGQILQEGGTVTLALGTTTITNATVIDLNTE